MKSNESPGEELKDLGLTRAHLIKLAQRINPDIDPGRSEVYSHVVGDPYANRESRSYQVEVVNLDTNNVDANIRLKRHGIREKPDLYDLPTAPPGLKSRKIDGFAKDLSFLRFFKGISILEYFQDQKIVVMEAFPDNLELKLIEEITRYQGGDDAQKGRIRDAVIEKLEATGHRAREYSSKATQALNVMRKAGAQKRPFFDRVGQPIVEKQAQRAFTDRAGEYLQALLRERFIAVGNSPDTYGYDRLKTRWTSDYVTRAITELRKGMRYLLSGNTWAHFDLRPQHVLLGDESIEFCDFEKAGIARWAIDPAMLIQNPLIDQLDISQEDRIRILKAIGTTEKEALLASVWAILKYAGTYALLQHASPESQEKYKLLTLKSPFYDNRTVIPNLLGNLEWIAENTKGFGSLERAVTLLNDLGDSYGKAPPIEKEKEGEVVNIDGFTVPAILIHAETKKVVKGNLAAERFFECGENGGLEDDFAADLYFNPTKFGRLVKELKTSPQLRRIERIRTIRGNVKKANVSATMTEDPQSGEMYILMTLGENQGAVRDIVTLISNHTTAMF